MVIRMILLGCIVTLAFFWIPLALLIAVLSPC